jgi:hypothetical protein
MTAHLSPAQALVAPGPWEDPHRSLHSETGPQPAEHPGRSKNPLIKVAGLAWLEFEKPDLGAAERFGTDFGFTVADRTPETLLLRGRWAGPACLVVRRGPHSRFVGTAYQAAARDDLAGSPAERAGRSPRTRAATSWCCATPAGSRCGSSTAFRISRPCPNVRH